MRYGPANPVPQGVKEAAIQRANMGEDLLDIAKDIGVARWTVAIWCRTKPVMQAACIANLACMPLVRINDYPILQED